MMWTLALTLCLAHGPAVECQTATSAYPDRAECIAVGNAWMRYHLDNPAPGQVHLYGRCGPSEIA